MHASGTFVSKVKIISDLCRTGVCVAAVNITLTGFAAFSPAHSDVVPKRGATPEDARRDLAC